MSYIGYYKELCPSEESWVHRQLSDEREEFEDEISKLRAELATFRAAQKACKDCDEPTVDQVDQLRARADQMEAKT